MDGGAVSGALQGSVGLGLKVKQDLALEEMLRRSAVILQGHLGLFHSRRRTASRCALRTGAAGATGAAGRASLKVRTVYQRGIRQPLLNKILS